MYYKLTLALYTSFMDVAGNRFNQCRSLQLGNMEFLKATIVFCYVIVFLILVLGKSYCHKHCNMPKIREWKHEREALEYYRCEQTQRQYKQNNDKIRILRRWMSWDALCSIMCLMFMNDRKPKTCSILFFSFFLI